jgi:hypothetical protein
MLEIYVKCALEECIRRDVKGLYKKVLNGEIQNFTGISDPYEAYMDYFDENRPIHEGYMCAMNPLHDFLIQYGRAERMLITYNKPDRTFSAEDISSIRLGNSTIDQHIALYCAKAFRQQGSALPPDSAQKHREALNHYYFLRSSLVYVAVQKRTGIESFLATKKSSILSALYTRLAPVDKKRGFDRFNSCYGTSIEELQTGVTAVVKVMPDADGYHLSKELLSINRVKMAVPFYSLNIYANAIADQKFLNLAPAYFDVHILRHPGYNLAGWKLHESERKQMNTLGGIYRVKDKPLRLIHFSGINIFFERVIGDWFPDRKHPLFHLRDEYVNEWEEIGRSALIDLPWSYNFFHSGEGITMETRLKCKQNPDLARKYDNPFAMSNGAFL